MATKDGTFMGQGPFGAGHFTRAAFAGATCCSFTHGCTTPIDVVKTRMQLDPKTYGSKGFFGTFKHIHAKEGMSGICTGWLPTAQGYFLQGIWKFGGVEFFKVKIATGMSERDAYRRRNLITMASATMAEFCADIFLCPFEACRIRLVSEPTYGGGSVVGTGKQLVKELGVVQGFYGGLGPMLFKQIPMTVCKFASQQKAAEMIYAGLGTTPLSCDKSTQLGVSLTSGLFAGVVAATVSQAPDGLLSKVNKKGAGGDGSLVSRLVNITKETGYWKLQTEGLGARWAHVGLITMGQFLILDAVLMAFGAQRLSFKDPDKK